MVSKGQIVCGTVERVFTFGVFARLDDGTRAYVRRRELTLAGDVDPRTIVGEGQPIKGIVTEEASLDRITEISVRVALPDPWPDFVRDYHQGDVVTVTVKRLLPDRVYAQILPGIDGLIPLDELSPRPIEQPEDIVWVSDRIEAVITHIDPAGKRVRLSVRHRVEQLARAGAVVEYMHQKAQAVPEPEFQAGSGSFESEGVPGAGMSGLVLVVEDHGAVREPLVKWLVEQGCRAEGVESGAEALERCQEHEYGLVIVDLNMPGMDGIQFVRQLRQAGLNWPVAVMSGPEFIEENMASLQALRVGTILPKPLDLEEIRHLLVQLARNQEPELPPARSQTGPTEAQPFQDLADVMRSGQPLGERFQRGLAQLVQETRAEAGMIFHFDLAARQVSLVAQVGDLPLDTQAIYSLIDSPVKDVILEGQVEWENQVSVEKTGRFRKLLGLLAFESCIGLPIQAAGQTEHALFLFHRQPDMFSRHRLRDSLAMATLFAVALESQILDERVQSLSRIFLSGHLAAGFGHEVYNRVSGLDLQFRNVRSASERLGHLVPGLAERAEFQRVQGDVSRLLDIVTELKWTVEEYQRLMRTEEERSVDVNLVVRQAEQQVRPLANRAKVEIQLKLAPNLPPAIGSGIRLQQVFLNLMLNAVQQMDNSGSASRLLTVSTSLVPESNATPIRVHLTDTGPGIHRQHWDKVFALGFTTRPGGSGLGLYIARSLVESMGGRIAVEESLMCLGTTFRVELPPAAENVKRTGP